MWLVIVLFVSALALLFYLDTCKPKNFPPGPKWLPFLGSGLQVVKLKKKTGYFLTASAEMAKVYGPVLGLKVGKEKLVVVCGPKEIKECLMSDDLAGRPIGEFYNLRTWGRRRGILLVDEDFWHDQRRFILRQLREFGFGTRNMSTLIEEEAQELVDYIHQTINNNDSVIFTSDSLFSVPILNTLWKMLAGVRYNPGDPKMKELQTILAELFSNILMVGATFSHYPILKYLAPEKSGYRLYVNTHLRLWEFLHKELEFHKKTHVSGEPRDFMDVYLDAINSSEKLSNNYTEEQLVAICLDLFMAGSETTSNTVGFCFLGLILNPEVQRKAQEEIDKVIGKSRIPTLQDRPNMPYVECVALEGMRMFGARALTVPHRALRDAQLGGYCIPKDTLVVVNLYESMGSPDSGYEDPEAFKPERFLRNGRITVPESFIPFGYGKHRCLGETLARANLFVFIAYLLQRYNFTTVADHPPPKEWREGGDTGTKTL
ncbi:hypothetical protein NQ318_019453 [Aromia moschata]|uniref:Cytochrome P450 303a1 n=1 Tax=Aromia moschata TaxID=1265417 RepID=A0AAV8XBM4_9CUCU|nr:hypothetical protein NQ318_019453 [Aromia moschata]